MYWYAPSNFLKLIRYQKINHSLLFLLNETIVHFNTASYKTPDKRIPIDIHQTKLNYIQGLINSFIFHVRTGKSLWLKIWTYT